ncbi:hypothetical protein Hanom_Chr13g01238531 [Helianthus anomalus]
MVFKGLMGLYEVRWRPTTQGLMEVQIHSDVLTHLHPNCRLDKNFLTYDINTCWLFIEFRIYLGIGG